jgi:hypothetical protein
MFLNRGGQGASNEWDGAPAEEDGWDFRPFGRAPSAPEERDDWEFPVVKWAGLIHIRRNGTMALVEASINGRMTYLAGGRSKLGAIMSFSGERLL